MGKVSQRKKQLRAQRKQKDQRQSQIHPASIPTIAHPDNPKTLTLLTIPLEIRFKIFSIIAHGPHTITIAPNFHIYSPLTGLIHSHPQLEEEIVQWRNAFDRPAIHPVFGDFDPAFTSFKITFRSNEQKITRVYEPEVAREKILTLELWKRSMDMMGTDKQFEVNRAIRYLTRRLWKWKPEMGMVSSTRECREMQEKMRFLLFDERRTVSVLNAPRNYEEPFAVKPTPDLKPKPVYRKTFETGHELSGYYRSLGANVGSEDDIRSLERVRASWVGVSRKETVAGRCSEESSRILLDGASSTPCSCRGCMIQRQGEGTR
ncbi:hypothetical protein VTL71DRAFT_3436 [Oculimacula yallundae]|uniref:Uncharacterized protein n=1 Tax=Oculimacula yallundae TaxID=86028 RepID=A0ABR4C8A9_9HELO